MVRSTGCSSKGPGFDSLYPYGGSLLSVTSASDIWHHLLISKEIMYAVCTWFANKHLGETPIYQKEIMKIIKTYNFSTCKYSPQIKRHWIFRYCLLIPWTFNLEVYIYGNYIFLLWIEFSLRTFKLVLKLRFYIYIYEAGCSMHYRWTLKYSATRGFLNNLSNWTIPVQK